MLTRRRILIGALAILAASPAVEAQQSGRVYRIGWLASARIPENQQALREGLHTLGYVEGDNIVIEEQYAMGTNNLDAAAAEMLRKSPAIIVTDGSVAALAVKRTAVRIPVVFVSGDPVGMGLVRSLSSPGGNFTGLALISTELNVKRLGLLKEALPSVSRLAFIYEPQHVKSMLPPIDGAARALGLSSTLLEVRDARDIERAFTIAVKQRVDAVMPLSSALFDAEKQRFVSLAAKHRLPAIYEHRPFAEAGGLMSYGPDIRDVFRRAATYIDRILKGAKPADLPVEQATKFELVINAKTAKALGLTIPPSLLSRADQVIE